MLLRRKNERRKKTENHRGKQERKEKRKILGANEKQNKDDYRI